jgi:ribonuclease HI
MSAVVAEYFAVRSALKWLNGSIWKKNDVEVISDAQTVIRQLTGQYNCYDPKIIGLRDECRRQASFLPGQVIYRWVRREENKIADVLSKALQIWGRQPTWEEVVGTKL